MASKSISFEGKTIAINKKFGLVTDKLTLSIDGVEVDSTKVILGKKTLRGEYIDTDGSYQQVFVDVTNGQIGIGKCILRVNGLELTMK